MTAPPLRDSEWLALIAKHQPITATELARVAGRTPSNAMHRCKQLLTAGLIDSEERMEDTTGTGQRRKVIRYSIALTTVPTALIDRQDEPWRPAPWVNPIRAAYLANRPMR